MRRAPRFREGAVVQGQRLSRVRTGRRHDLSAQEEAQPRGKDLTPEEKESNRLISRVRVKVEHSVGGVKVFRIVQDTFRNIKEGFVDLVLETVWGLFNFRLESRTLT